MENGQLKVTNAFITRDNINALFLEAGFSGEIDLLSIDIDGNDLYIWDAIESVDPRVVVTEYNGKFPPDLEWCQAYDASHVWGGIDWHGASLKAFERLSERKGYRLVGTDLRGCNAFFVRNDLAGELFYEPATAEALYNPLRVNLVFSASHPAKYCLAVQKDNLGILNYRDYELVSSFHLEEKAGEARHVWTSELSCEMKLLVKANVKIVEIPYRLPIEVLKNYSEYRVSIQSDLADVKEYDITEPAGAWRIVLKEKCRQDTAMTIHVDIPMLWSPADLMNSPDKRLLGIDIVLSEIKWF